jgi:hypothetical protein
MTVSDRGRRSELEPKSESLQTVVLQLTAKPPWTARRRPRLDDRQKCAHTGRVGGRSCSFGQSCDLWRVLYARRFLLGDRGGDVDKTAGAGTPGLRRFGKPRGVFRPITPRARCSRVLADDATNRWRWLPLSSADWLEFSHEHHTQLSVHPHAIARTAWRGLALPIPEETRTCHSSPRSLKR